MNRYQTFIFKSYNLDPVSKVLTLVYSLDNKLDFTESYKFDFEFNEVDSPEALDKAVQSLFFIAGVSYYKTFLPPNIKIEAGETDSYTANFFSEVYRRGLGEFFYINQLDPSTKISFPSTVEVVEPSLIEKGRGQLIGIGGGKDSLLSTELLSGNPDVATWSVGHRPQLEPLVSEIGLKHFWVEREWDKQLLDVNKQGAFNGHVPISAILACVGTVVAILTGYRDVVVSNESSASEPNLVYQGQPINHQYSKSLEFEKAYQKYLARWFGDSVRYYSLLRPLSEVRIAELFSKQSYRKYKNIFSSCNRAYTHISDKIYWCAQCPKCAFTYLILSPFLDKAELEELFSKNLLIDTDMEPVYRQILGIEGHKPLECVGEIKEARAAMRMAQKLYPQLDKYVFDLPRDYDYRRLTEHSMPSEIYSLVEPKFMN